MDKNKVRIPFGTVREERVKENVRTLEITLQHYPNIWAFQVSHLYTDFVMPLWGQARKCCSHEQSFNAGATFRQHVQPYIYKNVGAHIPGDRKRVVSAPGSLNYQFGIAFWLIWAEKLA